MKTDYEIITAPTHPTLVMEVRRYLNNGYVPQGGFVVWDDDGELWFGQAVVRNVPQSPESAPTNLKVTIPH